MPIWATVSGMHFGIAVQAAASYFAPATDSVAVAQDAQRPWPTTPPSVHGILRRQKEEDLSAVLAPDNTCGYVENQGAWGVFSCGSAYRCAFFVNSAVSFGAMGCCDGQGQGCGLRTACLNLDQALNSTRCASACMQDSFIMKCTESGRTLCNTVAFDNGVNAYFCSSVAVQIVPAVLTTPGQSRSFFTWSDNSSVTALTSGKISVSEAAPAYTVTVAVANSTSGTGTGSGSSSSSLASENVGAIVGGAVGGFAVLAFFTVAMVFIFRHRKETRDRPGGNDGNTASEIHPTTSIPQDPHWSSTYNTSPTPASQDPGKAPPCAQASAATSPPRPHTSEMPTFMAGDALNRYSLSTASPPLDSHRVSEMSFPGFQALIHEASGFPVGPAAYEQNHRGKMHELQ